MNAKLPVNLNGDLTITGTAGDKDIVLKGRVRTVELKRDVDYGNIDSAYGNRLYANSEKYTVEAEFDGAYAIEYVEKKVIVERTARIWVKDRRLSTITSIAKKAGVPDDAAVKIVGSGPKKLVVSNEVWIEFTWTEKV